MKRHFSWAAGLPHPFVTNVATLGPLGTSVKAPGTWGSAAGIAWFTVLFLKLDPISYLLYLAATSYIAMAICDEYEVRTLKKDPGIIIIDEFVAIPLCFFGLFTAHPITLLWPWVLAGFGLFRFFDIAKPLWIGQMQDLPGGIGVVADDLAAAIATCLCLHALAYAFM